MAAGCGFKVSDIQDMPSAFFYESEIFDQTGFLSEFFFSVLKSSIKPKTHFHILIKYVIIGKNLIVCPLKIVKWFDIELPNLVYILIGDNWKF